MTGAHEQAVAIYERLLKEARDPAARLPLLVNLGIADLRVARRESSVEAATAAIEKWSDAEHIAADLGYIGAWAQVRAFQSEADLLVAGIQRLDERRLSAAKRQLETIQDTQGILSEGRMANMELWWSQAIQPQNSGGMDGLESTSSPTLMEVRRKYDSISWTDQEYQAREDRIDRWMSIFRAEGDVQVVANLVGIWADLLRARGLRENDPGVLIASFEGTHEFQTRMGIVDTGVAKGELIIRIPEVVEAVELEASLALACADPNYIETLIEEIGVAELWCRRSSAEHCDFRRDWRFNVVAALEYGAASWEPAALSQDKEPPESEGPVEEVWRHATWARSTGARLAQDQTLCPNRPLGIAESKGRHHRQVDERTRAFQKLPHSSNCVLPRRTAATIPSLPAESAKMEKWRQDVEEWIREARLRFEDDVRAIKSCEGEPW